MNLPRADGRGSTSASAGELFGAIAAARNEVTVVGCEVEPGAYGRAKHLMRHHTCETRRQYTFHGRGAASQIPRSCHVGARDSRTEPSAVKYEIEWNLRQTVIFRDGKPGGCTTSTSTTTRVKVDCLLVGMAATTETDGGEMSLARAAGAGNRVGQCQGAAGHPVGREEHARPALLVPGRRLVSPPRDAVEDVVDLLIGAPGGMVGGEVLQERLGALALRRRKVLGESGFVHLSEQVEKAAAELSVELIGRGPLFLRRCLLRGAAVPRRVIHQPAARVTRVRARYRHDHLPI